MDDRNILKLKGKLSYINEFNKLVFNFIDGDDSRDKVCNYIRSQYKDIFNGMVSYSGDKFVVSLPKDNKYIPNEFIGLVCNIHVKSHKYNFTKEGKNYRGVYFTLYDIFHG